MTDQWKPLQHLTNELIADKKEFVIHVDTRDMHFTIGDQWELPVPCQCNPTKRAKPMTLDQVVDRLKDWDEKDFSWLHYSGKDKRCYLNSVFKYVRIVWTEKGFLWCFSSKEGSNKYVSVPEESIAKYVEFHYPYATKKRLITNETTT